MIRHPPTSTLFPSTTLFRSGSNLGCNPANPPTDATVASQVSASDTCSAVSTNVSHLDSTNGCVITRTFTVTITDACTNATSKNVVYSWTTDTTGPTLNVPAGSNLGCNPANPPTDATVASRVTASDTCSAVSTNVSHLDTTNGCVITRTFTVTATDACTNATSKNVVYFWTTDTTGPTLNVPTGSNLGCNPVNPPTDATVA